MGASNTKLRIGVLASGGGTNLQSIIDACSAGDIDAKIVRVICNNPDAGALQRAERARIPTCCINHRDFDSRATFDAAVIAQLQQDHVELVVLAGFMRIVGTNFVNAFPHRIMNIHPALLPKFGGKGMYGDRVHKAVVDAGETESGITIHYVNEHYDEGHIVFQAKCPVSIDDTPETVAQKVHALEYAHYPRVIEELISNLDTQ